MLTGYLTPSSLVVQFDRTLARMRQSRSGPCHILRSNVRE